MNNTATSVALHVLDSTNPASDFLGWTDAADLAERVLRHTVGCSPADGRVWAKWALLERAVVAPPERVAAMARLSERLAPSEIAAIRSRLELWRVASSELRGKLQDVLARDLARVELKGYLPDLQTARRIARSQSAY